MLKASRFKTFLRFIKYFLYSCFIVLPIASIVYLNYIFKIQSIQIEFFDQKEENEEIKQYVINRILRNGNSFLNYVFLDQEILTKEVHEEFQMVREVRVSKNLGFGVEAKISKNEEFFYTCVEEDFGFVVDCMVGSTEGVYYKDHSLGHPENINISIHKKVLYDAKTEVQIQEPDSLSGSRIYTKEDFKVLVELIRWVQKNGFEVQKVFVDDLKIVDIYTDVYKLKINLEKGYVNTVKDFEIVSRTGNLQKYIIEAKDKIDYIDLSYKDKVFYKLKNGEKPLFENAMKTDIMSTTSTTTR
jgi:hypothetical protein